MTFEEDIRAALIKACELDSENDAVHLAGAAQIMRHHKFREAKPFNGFPERCQEEYVQAYRWAGDASSHIHRDDVTRSSCHEWAPMTAFSGSQLR